MILRRSYSVFYHVAILQLSNCFRLSVAEGESIVYDRGRAKLILAIELGKLLLCGRDPRQDPGHVVNEAVAP